MTDADIVTRLRKFARDFSFTDTHSDFSLTEAADEIERLRQQRDDARRACKAWESNLEEPQEIDPADLQALMDAAWNGDRLTVRMSARDLWRMATDRKGREEE